MPSITYLEQVKIETFCRLKLPQVVISNYLNRAPAIILYELARCHPYRANLVQVDAERKRAHYGRIGDFEMDTIVGPRGHSKAVLLTLLGCKPRFFLLIY